MGILLAVAVACIYPDNAHAQKRWRTYEDSVLVEHKANDGDSFHVRLNKRRYILRLYWVDAAETDNSWPDRVAAQAEYFGITPQEAIRFGKEATRFARNFMKDGFTVHTKHQDALGRSERGRKYAIIEKNGEFLHIELVRAGLARIHGFQEVGPNMPSMTTMRLRIRAAESEARRERRGAWAVGKGEGNTLPDSVTLARTVTILDPENPSRSLGLLRAGATVEIIGMETPTLIRIQFKAGDEDMEGLCNRSELGI
ncbi:MAG TPA: thermonuclease family protein [Kiritimatiellia bacterium]|nr:thermonuclease family protein [Kiritimatiellia bacterium]HMO98551.1 thermonuclease family protein [Kiritimatiellia bacterium]HMP97918.1 thermonuclease family protein [Kiritimatiellia bacterium]